jgi:hypothetical protein
MTSRATDSKAFRFLLLRLSHPNDSLSQILCCIYSGMVFRLSPLNWEQADLEEGRTHARPCASRGLGMIKEPTDSQPGILCGSL